jgi:hypothetical protein
MVVASLASAMSRSPDRRRFVGGRGARVKPDDTDDIRPMATSGGIRRMPDIP